MHQSGRRPRVATTASSGPSVDPRVQSCVVNRPPPAAVGPTTLLRNSSTSRSVCSGSSANGQCPLSSRISTRALGKASRCRSAKATGR